jgi:2-polyprenyl-3-methyl-5-hydroxy-6-metoxy-1,4-benzoquinol methylase
MTKIDRILQAWRIKVTLPYIGQGYRVLDLGSADGELFRRSGCCGPGSMGIDPTLKASLTTVQGFQMISGYFPDDMPPGCAPFDVITMLAVLEHFPPSQYSNLADGIRRMLRPGGLLLITVPSAAVDEILIWLLKLRLIHGMSLQEHHGYDVNHTPIIFAEPAFKLLIHRQFQLGLNNLFVFQRAGSRP